MSDLLIDDSIELDKKHLEKLKTSIRLLFRAKRSGDNNVAAIIKNINVDIRNTIKSISWKNSLRLLDSDDFDTKLIKISKRKVLVQQHETYNEFKSNQEYVYELLKKRSKR